MKRFLFIFLVIVILVSGCVTQENDGSQGNGANGSNQENTGNGQISLFRFEEILEPEGLDINIISDEVVSNKKNPQQKARVITLDFTSQVWKGEVFRHDLTVFIPYPEIPETGKGYAIIRTGNPSWLFTYGFDILENLGVPVAVLGNLPGEHFNISNAGEFMSFAEAMAYEEKDPTWSGFYPMSVAYMRAMTLLQNLPEVEADKFFVEGCSKRGHTTYVVAAYDSRVLGAKATSAPEIKTEDYWRLLYKNYKPGAVKSVAEEYVNLFDSDPAFKEEIMKYYNPYQLKDNLKPMMLTLGTNEMFYPYEYLEDIWDGFIEDKNILYIAGADHCDWSDKQASALKLWASHVFFGRDIPEIITSWTEEDGVIKIKADIDTATDTRKVSVYYTFDEVYGIDGRALKASEWLGEEMIKEGTEFSKTIDLSGKDFFSYYIEVEDFSQGVTGFSSSLINFVKK